MPMTPPASLVTLTYYTPGEGAIHTRKIPFLPTAAYATASEPVPAGKTFTSALAWARTMAGTAGDGAEQPVAVLQATDGSYLLTKLQNVSFGTGATVRDRFDAAPFDGAGASYNQVSFAIANRHAPNVLAVVGSESWMDLREHSAARNRPLPTI